MYELIKTKPVFFPDEKKHGIAMSDACKDFITQCLSKDPTKRIGRTSDVKEVLSHPWFNDISVDALLGK